MRVAKQCVDVTVSTKRRTNKQTTNQTNKQTGARLARASVDKAVCKLFSILHVPKQTINQTNKQSNVLARPVRDCENLSRLSASEDSCLFVCLFVCLFGLLVCLFGWLFVCLVGCLFVCVFVWETGQRN